MTDGPSRATDRRKLWLAVFAVAVLAQPFLYAGAFAGDAQVHLVFMESAAQGRFFEFNPGERVSGETSPGYMLFGALLFRLLPAAAVPIVLKLVGLAAWWLLCWLVFRVAEALLANDGDGPRDRLWPAIAALTAASIPGSVYNANVGMENGIFAALVWSWILLAIRWQWFSTPRLSFRRELASAALLGLAFWLRPEALVVAVVAWTFRGLNARPGARVILAGVATTGAIGAACIAFQYACTGDIVATSILSRRILAMPNMVSLGPLTVDKSFAIRMLAYFPLVGMFIVGLKTGGPPSPTEKYLRLLLACFAMVYTVWGSIHLGRYLIFLMPVLAIGAAHGARWLWQRKGREGKLAVALAALALVGIETLEHRQRLRLFPHGLLEIAVDAPRRRHARTDEWLRNLGSPDGRPVVVALESVQFRYELDDRIVVRSLDGRVDRALLAHASRDAVDHLGYIRQRAVQYLLDTPSYDRDPTRWSLASLRRLRPGERLAVGSTSFRRLQRSWYAIAPPAASNDRTGAAR